MDEPLNGLDPDSVIIIRDLLEAFKTIDQIVIVSSHNLDELDKVTDRLIFKVDHGLSLETVARAEARYAELYRRPRRSWSPCVIYCSSPGCAFAGAYSGAHHPGHGADHQRFSSLSPWQLQDENIAVVRQLDSGNPRYGAV